MRKKMSRIYYTIPGAQDSRYGISHTNITDKLTKDNYVDKAIVRGSDYIWIKKADKGKSRKETITVIKITTINYEQELEEEQEQDE